MQSNSFSRFMKSRSKLSNAYSDADDDEWYIPYNGPYEAAPRSGKEKEKTWDVDDDWRGRPRASTVSSSSRPRRRSTYSNNRPQAPSYINLDAAGGVGESPIPLPRPVMPERRDSSVRASLASIFARRTIQKKPKDYYDSYYSTLTTTPKSPTDSEKSPSPHPYAYAFPVLRDDRPHTATVPTFSVEPPPLPLKNSSSTPNLRKAPPPLQMKDRWLSAESWCDAILFPRPRFKTASSAPRIVSPPGSPLARDFANTTQEGGIASRVLAHSRSMVDLTNKPTTPERPKSFALDDLALISPVPSLARVLEEGQILSHQRQKWNNQATSSLGNKRARSLSRSHTRARSKSLAARPQKTVEYLAARSLLGNQLISVTKDENGGHKRTLSKSSKSHSRTDSKGSRSQQGHSRNDSWSKSALRAAKGICGFDNTIVITPPDEKAARLEGALSTDETRIIHLEDPTERAAISPSPGSVDVYGIALGTPPLSEENAISLSGHPYAQGGMYTTSPTSHSPPKRADDYAGAHPIMYSQPESTGRHPYAGPSRTTQQPFAALAQQTSPSQQHSPHPYAHQNPRDSYTSEVKIVARPRADSDVPPPSKMWAALSPTHANFASEILPTELRYSPYTADSSNRSSLLGVGEALNYVRGEGSSHDGDSGLGLSEENEKGKEGRPRREVKRKPVQYDASRPAHAYMLSPTAPLFSAHSRLETIHSVGSPEDSGMLTPAQQQPLSHRSGSSPGDSTNSSQPGLTMGGGIEDLDNFRDLFYRPEPNDEVIIELERDESFVRPSGLVRDQSSSDIIATLSRQNSAMPGDLRREPSRRTGSGLTTLAKQLSEELEEISLNQGQQSSPPMDYRHLSMASSYQTRPSTDSAPRATPETGLHFVISGNRLVDGGDQEPGVPEDHRTLPFRPTVTIPEDVDGGSITEGEVSPSEDVHLNLKAVSSLATPPPVSSDHRRSFSGQVAFAGNPQARRRSSSHLSAGDDYQTLMLPARRSGSAPLHSSDFTRSSYMTSTSDASRMSGLSDFPVPPSRPLMAGDHTSSTLLGAYFAQINGRDGSRVFNENYEVEELLEELSSPVRL